MPALPERVNKESAHTCCFVVSSSREQQDGLPSHFIRIFQRISTIHPHPFKPLNINGRFLDHLQTQRHLLLGAAGFDATLERISFRRDETVAKTAHRKQKLRLAAVGLNFGP